MLAGPSFATVAFAAEGMELTIVYASNMPNIETKEGMGGYAELGSLLAEERGKSKNVLFLHGGGSLGPSPLSSFDHGAHMIDIINSLEPSAMGIGKREFSFREDELIQRTYEAAFPMLNGNTHDPATNSLLEGVEPTQLFSFGSYTVGVMAMIDPLVMEEYRPDRISMLDTETNIKKYAKVLREQGADFIVLLSGDMGVDNKKLIEEGIVNCVFLRDSEEQVPNSLEHGVLIQGMMPGSVAIVSLQFKGDKKDFSWEQKSSIKSLADFSPLSSTQALVSSYLKRLTQILDTSVCRTTTALDTRRKSVRTAENAFGNLVADAFRTTYKADVALMNGGGIRGDRTYPANVELTRRDISTELPFPNQVVLINVTGKQLKDALENGFSKVETAKGRFPHISGVVVKYDPTAPAGKRLVSVEKDGTPIKDEGSYSLVTLDFMAQGGDGYTMFKDCKLINNLNANRFLKDVVLGYVTNKKSISPKVDGRLLVVTP